MKKNETAESIAQANTFWVGGRVQWTAGNTRREGLIIDIYTSGTPSSTLSVRCSREHERVLVIQQRDGRVLMKLESDVNPV
jgi:hypothetical protein